ncbi:unnamed protein product [Lasius platythorax]|uniref:Uncharacterized protein n=1 Tax=Lasius platythorax TaxID=488582 RepID=A0AAV2NQT8_9HYME
MCDALVRRLVKSLSMKYFDHQPPSRWIFARFYFYLRRRLSPSTWSLYHRGIRTGTPARWFLAQYLPTFIVGECHNPARNGLLPA